MRYPALVVAIPLTFGLAVGVSAETWRLTLPAVLIMAAGWVIAALGYRWRVPRAVLVGVVLTVGVAGVLLGARASQRALESTLRIVLDRRFDGLMTVAPGAGIVGETVVLEGRLRDDASRSASGAVLHVDVALVQIGEMALSASGGVVLGVGGTLHDDHIGNWTAGRQIRAPALLRRPARYLNDGVPDQERSLARRGITLVGSVKSAALVDVLAEGPWWAESAARVRHRVRMALARHVPTWIDAPGALATAILIGDRAGLAPEVEQRLQEAGTYHVLAISGGNIAIFVGLVMGLGRMGGADRRLAACGTILLLAAYTVVVVGGASVARATAMAIVYLFGSLIDQRTAGASSVAVSAVLLFLSSPLWVTDVGCWLTFGATIAILAGASVAPSPWWWASRAVALATIASASVELALAPVTALVFQRVTLAGPVLNLVALPAMAITQVAAMAVVIADAVGWHVGAGWMGLLVYASGFVLVDSAQLASALPWISWRVPSPAPLTIVTYYSAIVAAMTLTMRGGPRPARLAAWTTAMTLLAGILVVPSSLTGDNADGRLRVTVMDVGQGDALLITFPNGQTLQVDTGGPSRGEFDVGDRVLGPALRGRGVRTLDYLSVTHADPDHVGGAASLLRDFTPREVWWGIPVLDHEPTDRLRAEALERRTSWRTIGAGAEVQIGGVEVRVHHPPAPEWARVRVRNDDSLVMELRFGRVSVLLTGDISRDVEQALLPRLDLLPIVVLKVAHHGSATSTGAAFLEHIKPAIALIGVGRGNPYGHPAPAVLARLRAVGAEVFRTDLDGQIDVATDGHRVDVATLRGRASGMERHGPG